VTTDESGIEAETLTDFLARPEVSPEVYASLRALHRPGMRGDEPSQKLWNITRRFHPKVHVGRIQAEIAASKEFPPDTFAEVKSALLYLEAGLAEFANHGVRRLILRPKRERLEAALRTAPPPPHVLAARLQAALSAAAV
jgi:hypothetical protein